MSENDESRVCRNGHAGPWTRQSNGDRVVTRCLTCRRIQERSRPRVRRPSKPAVKRVVPTVLPCALESLPEEYSILRRDGMSTTRIATMWGVKVDTLRAALRRAGVESESRAMTQDERDWIVACGGGGE